LACFIRKQRTAARAPIDETCLKGDGPISDHCWRMRCSFAGAFSCSCHDTTQFPPKPPQMVNHNRGNQRQGAEF
jgi:hypothetical protein